jgi:indole-3-glycerol phosphate synthase
VAESGVHGTEDAKRMMQAGGDALLVGTALMERPEMLGELIL